jgi:hypothetical protein
MKFALYIGPCLDSVTAFCSKKEHRTLQSHAVGPVQV